MGAQGSRMGISIKKETVFGEAATGQFTGVNHTTEDFKSEDVNKESKTRRSDRQSTGLIQVGANAGGGFDSELQSGNVDILLPSCLWSDTDWVSAGTVTGNVSFTTETGAGVGGIIAFGVGDTINLVPGNFFTIEGPNNNPLNVGIFQVKAVNGKNVQVYSPLFTQAAIAGVILSGSNIRNGVTRNSWTIEKSLYDVDAYFLYTGSVVDSFEVSIEAEEAVAASISFVSMQEILSGVEHSSPAPTALLTNTPFSASTNIGAVVVDGVELGSCEMQKISFIINQKAEGKKGIGFLGNCDVVGRSIAVTGKVSLFFNSLTQYQKYKNAESFSFVFKMTDNLGKIYVFELPLCKYDKASANAKGKDDDVIFEATFNASIGANGYTYQITKSQMSI